MFEIGVWLNKQRENYLLNRLRPIYMQKLQSLVDAGRLTWEYDGELPAALIKLLSDQNIAIPEQRMPNSDLSHDVDDRYLQTSAESEGQVSQSVSYEDIAVQSDSCVIAAASNTFLPASADNESYSDYVAPCMHKSTANDDIYRDSNSYANPYFSIMSQFNASTLDDATAAQYVDIHHDSVNEVDFEQPISSNRPSHVIDVVHDNAISDSTVIKHSSRKYPHDSMTIYGYNSVLDEEARFSDDERSCVDSDSKDCLTHRTKNNVSNPVGNSSISCSDGVAIEMSSKYLRDVMETLEYDHND